MVSQLGQLVSPLAAQVWPRRSAPALLALVRLASSAAGFAVGLAACCAVCPAWSATEFPLAGGSGFICARKLGAAAPINSPNPSVIAERIVRSFPLRVSQPRCLAWPPLREPRRNQQAW